MAKVTYKRVESNAQVDGIPILDGQLIYSKQGKTYMDYGTDRVPINGTPDTEMSESSTNPVENWVIKSYVDTNISSLASTIDNGTILWTNENPTSNFSSKTVNLSETLDNFDAYRIIHRQSTSNSRYISTGMIPVGHGTFMVNPLSLNQYRSTAENTSGSSVTFTAGYQAQSDGSFTENNSLVIPMYIIGYKTGLF